MNAEGTEARRPRLSRADKIILVALIALVVALGALSMLRRGGIALIQGNLMLYGPCLLVALLLGWGALAIFRRIGGRGARMAVGTLLAVVLFLVFTVGFAYASFVANITIPGRYAVIASPSGARQLVVLRSLDPEEDRIEARRAARLAADPGADPEVAVEDWGYVYRAYPRVGRLFYRADADVEGEVCIGYASGGELMMEWQTDESAVRFFVQDPETADGGECIVRF